MSKLGWWLIAAVIVASGCRFDPSGPATLTDGSVAPPDAPRGRDGAPPDASATCPQAKVVISVDGVIAPQQETNEPVEQVLVGDTVTLSAAGSCVTTGPISYHWDIQPATDRANATAKPGLDAKTITVYPPVADGYVVSLTVTDGNGVPHPPQPREVFGFSAYGSAVLPGTTLASSEIRDIDVGGGRLWVASKDGAYDASATDFKGFTAVNSDFSGDSIDMDVGSVYFEGAANNVWFGDQGPAAGVWRVSLGAGNSTEIDFGEDSQARRIGPGDGLSVATDHGLFSTSDDMSFGTPFAPAMSNLQAVASASGHAWVGGNRLYDANDPSLIVDPLAGAAGPDDKIRALAVYKGELWIGTDGHGVVQASATTGAAMQSFTAATSALPSDNIRDIAIEQSGPFAGDGWVATDAGIARFKRDRGIWVAIGSNSPNMPTSNDVRAIAVGQYGGARAIYAGTAKGVVYISTP